MSLFASNGSYFALLSLLSFSISYESQKGSWGASSTVMCTAIRPQENEAACGTMAW